MWLAARNFSLLFPDHGPPSESQPGAPVVPEHAPQQNHVEPLQSQQHPEVDIQ